MPAAPPRLRAWSPTSDDPRSWTLRRAYAAHKLPELVANQAGTTQSAYHNMLTHWERCTDNPRLDNITKELLEEFRNRLELDGYPASTIRKLGTLLRALLRRLAPAEKGNPQGAGIIEAVPYLALPTVGRRRPRNANCSELDAVYNACRLAEWPQIDDVPAPDFWRALVCGMYNLGPRAWDILHDGSDPKRGWFWEQYRPYLCSPAGTKLTSITFVPHKTGDELRSPVHPVLAAHLEMIRTDRRAMFPATLHHGSIYDQWKAIKSAAGVGVEGTPDLDFHDLRRTCQSEWDWLRDGLGDWILGHAPQDVGGRSYRNFERHAAEECEKLPQPESFLTIFQRPSRRPQGRLF